MHHSHVSTDFVHAKRVYTTSTVFSNENIPWEYLCPPLCLRPAFRQTMLCIRISVDIRRPVCVHFRANMFEERVSRELRAHVGNDCAFRGRCSNGKWSTEFNPRWNDTNDFPVSILSSSSFSILFFLINFYSNSLRKCIFFPSR